jgi:predicted acyl esterase
VPMYHVTSWYDIFLQGGLANFSGLRRNAMNDTARAAQKLLVGPWAHLFPYTSPTSTGTGESTSAPPRYRPPRDPAPLVRSLAEGRRHRHPRRAARQDLRHGRQSLARRTGMAAGPHALHALLPPWRRPRQQRARRRRPEPPDARRGAARRVRATAWPRAHARRKHRSRHGVRISAQLECRTCSLRAALPRLEVTGRWP